VEAPFAKIPLGKQRTRRRKKGWNDFCTLGQFWATEGMDKVVSAQVYGRSRNTGILVDGIGGCEPAGGGVCEFG
jgi:hypothetical protein